MITLLTITHKGQVTLSKKILGALDLAPGDKIMVRVTDNKEAILEPAGRGILDLVGKLGKIRIPKGKTVDGLIHEAREALTDEEIRRY